MENIEESKKDREACSKPFRRLYLSPLDVTRENLGSLLPILKKLPDTIRGLKNLETLFLSQNKVTLLPVVMGVSRDYGYCRLPRFPDPRYQKLAAGNSQEQARLYCLKSITLVSKSC